MKKTKADIHWLPEDEYKKAIFHFRSQINDLLMENFNMYGLGDNIPGAVESIVNGAVDFSLVCRGLDKIIKVK
jgi:hypothetical protein